MGCIYMWSNQEPNRLVPITILNALKKNKFDCSHGNQLKILFH